MVHLVLIVPAEGSALCKGPMQVFADGVAVLETSQGVAQNLDVSIPSDTQVVGVRCKAPANAKGLAVSFTNGERTDASWKCSMGVSVTCLYHAANSSLMEF